jgi:hypothetical protein
LNCKTKIEYKNLKTSLFTWTSDMGCWSFSLPPGKEGACPMAVTGPNSICGGCYAMLGRYNMPNVLNAQWIRFMWIKSLLETDEGQREFELTMIDSINRHVKNRYFRFFDSGDIFCPQLADSLYNICNTLSHIQFWFPTRSYWAKSKRWQTALQNLASLPNVALRPSALYYNQEAPILDGYAHGTTVVTSIDMDIAKLCPKTVNGGSCESNNCRACWDKTGAIAYLVHGVMGKSEPYEISTKIKSGRAAMRDKFVALTVSGASK